MGLFAHNQNKSTLQKGLDRDKSCGTSSCCGEQEAAQKQPEKTPLFKTGQKPAHHVGQACGCEKH